MIEAVALLSLFLVGLSYGATACLLSCMPLLSPILLANARSFQHGMGVLLPFSLGRITSYMMMAIAAFVSVDYLRSVIDNPDISRTLLSSSTLAVALLLLYRSFKPKNGACSSTPPTHTRGSAAGYFWIGLALAINPCMPVMTLIATAAASPSLSVAAFMGIAFGLGAITASLLFYGFLISSIARNIIGEFKAHHHLIERFAALLLIVTALAVFNGWLRL